MLTCLFPVLFTFYIQGELKLKKIIPAPKGYFILIFTLSKTVYIPEITEAVQSRTLCSYRCIFPTLYRRKSATFSPAHTGGLPPRHSVNTSHRMVNKQVAWPCFAHVLLKAFFNVAPNYRSYVHFPLGKLKHCYVQYGQSTARFSCKFDFQRR